MKSIQNSRVLVTSTSYGMNDGSLRSELESAVAEVVYNPYGRPMSSNELIPLVRETDGMIAGLDEIDWHVINAADRLKVIARYGVGLDRVDLAAAETKGIVVTNTPGANATSVAELTIGLILSLLRSIPTANTMAKAGKWPRLKGTTLAGKTVGLIGLGAIGRRVAALLSGFDCKILGYDPVVDDQAAKELGVEWRQQEQVARQSDILSLHLPLLPSTENMVDGVFISGLKEGVYLINTARSELLDETAVVEAIRTGKIAGAALDTFRVEPPPPDHPLLKLENVIATPHTGSHTEDATNRMGRMALHDCLAVLRGEKPRHRVI